MLRILIFLAANIAVMLVLGVFLSLIGIDGYLTGTGLDLFSLLVFSAVFGFAGSFISLFLSKWMAKMAMRVQIIKDARDAKSRWLMERVAEQAKKLNMPMPEVGIFPSQDVNAFATGYSKKSALVAVSAGLLSQMRDDEVEAVLAHEMAHIANGDMVTLSLVQGVVNTFVIFLSRIAGYFVDRVVFRNENGHGIGFFITSIVAQIVFGILATPIVMWFSRRREFFADKGSAKLVGKEKMIAALERLKSLHPQPLPDEMMAFGISGGPGKWGALFASHPPIDARIRALRSL